MTVIANILEMHTYTVRQSKQIESNVSLQFPQSSASVDPEAAEGQEEEEEEDPEEQERAGALLQRKTLLHDLGVVDQISQLLQGRGDTGGGPQDASTQPQIKQPHQRQHAKVLCMCVV